MRYFFEEESKRLGTDVCADVLTELLVDLLDDALAPRLHLVIDHMHFPVHLVCLVFFLVQLEDLSVELLDLGREGTVSLGATVLLSFLVLHL